MKKKDIAAFALIHIKYPNLQTRALFQKTFIITEYNIIIS